MSRCKIQSPQTLGGKIQILKLQGVKSKHSQILEVQFAIYPYFFCNLPILFLTVFIFSMKVMSKLSNNDLLTIILRAPINKTILT